MKGYRGLRQGDYSALILNWVPRNHATFFSSSVSTRYAARTKSIAYKDEFGSRPDSFDRDDAADCAENCGLMGLVICCGGVVKGDTF